MALLCCSNEITAMYAFFLLVANRPYNSLSNCVCYVSDYRLRPFTCQVLMHCLKTLTATSATP